METQRFSYEAQAQLVYRIYMNSKSAALNWVGAPLCVRARALVSPPVGGGMTSSSEAPPLIEEDTPFLNTYMSRGEQKTFGHGIPKGLGTENYCAGEVQQ